MAHNRQYNYRRTAGRQTPRHDHEFDAQWDRIHAEDTDPRKAVQTSFDRHQLHRRQREAARMTLAEFDARTPKSTLIPRKD